MRRRQTMLPEEMTQPAVGGVGYARGFSVNQPTPPRPQESHNKPSIVSDYRQHKFNSFTVDLSTVERVFIGQNEYRRFISFQNNGTVNAFIAFGIVANLNGTNSFILPPNGYLSFEFGIVPNNEIHGIASTGCRICVIEGVIQ